jgi:diguanylate cyclase (GGDEF)-like protein
MMALNGRRVLGRGRAWSVGAHLGAIVVGVVIVFGALGAYSAFHTIGQAREQARADASFQADLAGRSVASAVAAMQERMAAFAATPGLSAVFATPEACTLTFTDVDFFPGGHLDLITPDGRVACTSLAAKGAPAGASHAGEGWLSALPTTKGPIASDPTIDGLTKRNSMMIAATMLDEAKQPAGAVVLVLPIDGMARELGRVFGGPQHYEFSVTGPSDVLLSVDVSADARTNPVTRSGVLFGSQAVADRGWRIFAGITESSALRPTYSVLLREALLGAGALVVTLLALTLVQRRIARPLEKLTQTVVHASDHRGDGLTRIKGPAEVAHLATEIDGMIATRDAYELELSRQALHDPLTGLANRALLADRLTHALDRAPAPGTVAVVFIDLDHFKLVNDSLGHGAGDQALLIMADRVKAAVPAGTTVARFGGDEFIVVWESASADDVTALAERLLEAVAQPVQVADRVVTVTASIGIATNRDASRGEDLVREADTAMYVAKELGRARCHRFSESLRHQVTRRLTAENELRAALERDELHVVYQPILDLAHGETVGAEALLRWEHPALGSVTPATFIPIAEETGLILPIGRFVLEEACRQAAAWRGEGLPIAVSVNLSGLQITEAGLADLVARVLAETGLPPDQLCLELTESVLMSDATRTLQTLAELKAMGVFLSVDDFGTGYSSLAYLKQFPVDEIKIDRAFVSDLTVRPDQRTLVSAMIAMGKALGLRIVAEGVETPAQVAYLRELDCDLAQGYLFSTPQPATELTPFLRRSILTDATPSSST